MIDRLTPTEQRVLVMVAAGMSTSQVAARFGRSLETIKSQRRSILEKLGARNIAHAVAIAFREGLLS